MDNFYSKIKVDPATGCHEWQGSLNQKGYGNFWYSKKCQKAHRVAWYLRYGEWPEVCCHKCDNPRCVNPEHLFNGTYSDNARDRDRKGRSGRRKLTPELVAEARERYRQGETQRSLAKEMGVSPATMCLAISGKQWSSLEA